MIHPQPKGPKRKTIKGRKARKEKAVKTTVRELCVERDGFCRFGTYRDDVRDIVGPCDGRSEWMHLGDKKRARTRGMAPEVRHTTADSMMGCSRHHRDYDAGRMQIVALSGKGADGLLMIWKGLRSCIV